MRRHYGRRTRVNQEIRMPQLRVIGADGTQIGVISNREALRLAKEDGLDLVEVDPRARPPVCRIMDYGKFKYEESKKEKLARKKQHLFQIKEIRMRPHIDQHDYEVKLRHAKEFLTSKSKVKVTVRFRGREMTHPELGRRILSQIAEDLSDIAVVEQQPKMEGRNLTSVLSPK